MNRLCTEQIYNNQVKAKKSDAAQKGRSSIEISARSLKIMEELKKMVSENMRLQEEENLLKTNE